MQSSKALEQILRSFQVWRGHEIASVRARSTGYPELDGLLPGQGWPLNSLIELIPIMEGIGELRLIVPALKKICQQGRDIVFVRPPHLPYPPALSNAGLPLNRIVLIEPDNDENARWVAEQTLREGAAGAVLLWSDSTKNLALRRLQLAAQESGALTFLYRSPGVLDVASPAPVRLVLSPQAGALRVEVLKARGGRASTLALHFHSAA